jgi:hypothetical protein
MNDENTVYNDQEIAENFAKLFKSHFTDYNQTNDEMTPPLSSSNHKNYNPIITMNEILSFNDFKI